MRKFLRVSKMVGAVVGVVGGSIFAGPVVGAVMAIPGMPPEAAQPVTELVRIGFAALTTYAAPANR